MSNLLNKLQSTVAIAVLAGFLAPQAVFAKGGHGGGMSMARTSSPRIVNTIHPIKSPVTTGQTKVTPPKNTIHPILSPVDTAPKKIGPPKNTIPPKKSPPSKDPTKTDPTKDPNKNQGQGGQLLQNLLSNLMQGGGGGGGGDDGGSSGGVAADAPVADAQLAAQPMVEAQPAVAQAAGSVDLVLEDVEIAQPATLIAGPAYRVKFRNQGLETAGAFGVGVFATIDGELTDESPKAVVDVPGLAAGQSAEVVLRLPAAAMKIVSVSTKQASAFNQLIVAVDFTGAVSETDKTNNVVAVDRADLEAK